MKKRCSKFKAWLSKRNKREPKGVHKSKDAKSG